MTASDRLKAARGGVELAKASLAGIRHQAQQAMRELVRAEAALETAERRQQDLSFAREDMQRARKASDFLNDAVEECEQFLFLSECSVSDARLELELEAIFGPEQELPIWG